MAYEVQRAGWIPANPPKSGPPGPLVYAGVGQISDPKNVMLAAAAIAAIGWLAWRYKKKKRRPFGPFCSRRAGPRLRKVNRITRRGGMPCPAR